MLISGNRTEWSPIRSVIIRVINKIGPPRSGSPICLIKTQEIRNFVLLAVKKISHLSARLMARTRADEELRRNCSPIGHNNTKHFLCPIRSRHPLEFLEIVRLESVPRGSFARNWKLSSRLFSRPDWLPLGLRGCSSRSLILCRPRSFAVSEGTPHRRLILYQNPVRKHQNMGESGYGSRETIMLVRRR